MGRDNPHRENAFDRRTIGQILAKAIPGAKPDPALEKLLERVK